MPETPRPSLALPPIMRDGCETIVEAYANISFLFVFRFFFSFQRNNIKLEYLYNRKEDWNFSISLRNFFFSFSASREPLGLSIQRRTRALHKSVWTMESRKLANEKVSRRGIERAPARWSSSFKRFSTPFLLVSRAFRTPASSISSS